MHQILWLLYIAIIWYKKSTSLPKLYLLSLYKFYVFALLFRNDNRATIQPQISEPFGSGVARGGGGGGGGEGAAHTRCHHFGVTPYYEVKP